MIVKCYGDYSGGTFFFWGKWQQIGTESKALLFMDVSDIFIFSARGGKGSLRHRDRGGRGTVVY